MALLFAAISVIPLSVHALSPDHYATSSVMAEGRWARIKIAQTGMHVISDAEIRKLGFSDPSKVHVYGAGGQQVSYGLDANMYDDLPLLPSVRTAKGLVFFAVDHFTWNPTDKDSSTPYYHDIHAYSDDSWYFLSDRPVETNDMLPAASSATLEGDPRTTFTDRQVYEKELDMAGESGSQIYGEDFRTKRSQTFNFTLTDAADDRAQVYVRFAAKTTNGTSQLSFKANGKSLPSTVSDKVASSQAASYCQVTETSKEISGLDGSLALSIDYSQTGVLFMARLDYIETFYERHLRLNKGELHFFAGCKSRDGFSIAGCSPSTRIWDVTKPWAPREVKFTLRGDKAEFSVLGDDYREFVAFDADAVTRAATPAGAVANQNIHGLPTPDMVIITLPEYRTGAERIAALHEQHDGFRVHVVDAQQVYNEFSGGKKDVGAFRKMLKMWHDRGGDNSDALSEKMRSGEHRLGYALLMGKPVYDNKGVTSAAKNCGYNPMPIYESYSGLDEHNSYSNDDIIGMLDDVSADKFRIYSANLTIPVGRIPVTTGQEAVDVAAKLEKFVKNPTYGSWRNKVMIIADDDDNGVHFDQAQAVYSRMRSAGNGRSFVYDRLYLDSYKRVMTGVGPTYPQATERMLANYNDGVIYTDYIGHASPSGWGHEHLWEWKDITTMTNKNLTFIFAATCGFGYWDLPSRSGAEHLMLNPNGGVVGMMVATRSVYISQNGQLNSATHDELFARDSEGRARRFGDVYIAGRNKYKDSNNLRYAFMGDPAIRVPSAEYSVQVESVDNKDVTPDSFLPYPVIEARSSAEVSGRILRPDGSLDEDFNGTIELQLYDAERVVTTFGQGDRGAVKTYNDRNSRLSVTKASVENGLWTATLRVPPEIQGNYTTAMISCYAWSGDGREANGICERLYVYGYNSDNSDDTDGPDIRNFYVNNPNFTNGGLVNSNPVLFATISDASGINISDSGIGHGMTVTVDGKDVYSGLNLYFETDADDPDTGRLAYPLEGISSGRHTLTLTVWDNVNNCSKATIDINVGGAIEPTIYDINTLMGSDGLEYAILLDRPNTQMECEIGIFDLNGRRLWSNSAQSSTDIESTITGRWNFCDAAGGRVPRGIYIIRATVETPEGTYNSKSKKIAVPAQ